MKDLFLIFSAIFVFSVIKLFFIDVAICCTIIFKRSLCKALAHFSKVVFNNNSFPNADFCFLFVKIIFSANTGMKLLSIL